MNERADHVPTGTELLDFQLRVMRDAMTWMASGTQQLMQLGMAAACGKAMPGLRLPNAKQLASASKDYALRVQEDVDSVLHAFAMAPVQAERLIRTAALGREGPLKTSTRAHSRAPAKGMAGKRRATLASGEHAR
ncbi:MAG TPA: hypothetical protein VKD22_07710 [Ramlibacter sp.]|nr:hypothetical protein [Ramlibacter sp.]